MARAEDARVNLENCAERVVRHLDGCATVGQKMEAAASLNTVVSASGNQTFIHLLVIFFPGSQKSYLASMSESSTADWLKDSTRMRNGDGILGKAPSS